MRNQISSAGVLFSMFLFVTCATAFGAGLWLYFKGRLNSMWYAYFLSAIFAAITVVGFVVLPDLTSVGFHLTGWRWELMWGGIIGGGLAVVFEINRRTLVKSGKNNFGFQ